MWSVFEDDHTSNKQKKKTTKYGSHDQQLHKVTFAKMITELQSCTNMCVDGRRWGGDEHMNETHTKKKQALASAEEHGK